MRMKFFRKMIVPFSLSRPPGHHATPSRGMGFCLFNHIAIAARYARASIKSEKF